MNEKQHAPSSLLKPLFSPTALLSISPRDHLTFCYKFFGKGS